MIRRVIHFKFLRHLSAEFQWNFPPRLNISVESTRTKLAAILSVDCPKYPNNSGLRGDWIAREIPRQRLTRCWCESNYEVAWPIQGTQQDHRTSSKLVQLRLLRSVLHRTIFDGQSYENCNEVQSTLNFDKMRKGFWGKFSVCDFDAMKTETKLKLDEENKWKQQDFHDHSRRWEKKIRQEILVLTSFCRVSSTKVSFFLSLDYESKHQECFVDTICPYVSSIDFSYTLQAQKVDHTFTLKDLIAFALGNLSNKYRGICITSATIIKQLTLGLIKFDQDVLLVRNNEDYTGKNDDNENMDNNHWHILDTFRETLTNYQSVIKEYIEDFRWEKAFEDWEIFGKLFKFLKNKSFKKLDKFCFEKYSMNKL